MALLVPDAAEAVMFEAFLNKTAPQELDLQLYSSNTTPAESDTEVTYTVTTGGGYADIQLTAANWTVTPGAPTTAAQPQQTFTFTGAAGNVYGYLVVQRISGLIMWAERFTNCPFNIQNNGDEIKVTPSITLE